MLAPTRIYVKPVLALLKDDTVDVNAMVHITGGGFYENVPRVLKNPDHAALINRDSWQWPELFNWLQTNGNIANQEMLTTFNCGIGLVLVVEPDAVPEVATILTDAGETVLHIGELAEGDGPEVRYSGTLA